MNLITVSKSYLDKQKLDDYFSLNEINILNNRASFSISQETLLGRIALKHSYVNNNFNLVRIDYSSSGQPIIADDPNVYCSIAHSFGMAVGVSSRFKIGVDIEKIRPHDESLLKFIATEREIKMFNENDQNILVTKIWVIKEAASKALGLGINYPFSKIKILSYDNLYIVSIKKTLWTVQIFIYNNYTISICAPLHSFDQINIHLKYFS